MIILKYVVLCKRRIWLIVCLTGRVKRSINFGKRWMLKKIINNILDKTVSRYSFKLWSLSLAITCFVTLKIKKGLSRTLPGMKELMNTTRNIYHEPWDVSEATGSFVDIS